MSEPSPVDLPSLPPSVLPTFPLPVSLLGRTITALVLSPYISAFFVPLPPRWCTQHVFVYVHVRREGVKEKGRPIKGEGVGMPSKGPSDGIFPRFHAPAGLCTFVCTALAKQTKAQLLLHTCNAVFHRAAAFRCLWKHWRNKFCPGSDQTRTLV